MKYSKSLVGAGLLALISVAFLPGCGSSYSSPTTPSSPTPPAVAADVTILIAGMAGNPSFSPASAPVKVGQTVAWQNNDSITHDIGQDGGGFSSSGIGPGTTSEPVKITTAGNLGYHCMIHPSMTGSLAVTQ